MTPPPPERLAVLDAIKAVASQLIVLHHLAFYGPMSDRALVLAPEIFGWFAEHARLAVQPFLVMGGFLAARALARHGQLLDRPLAQIVARRYLRLAVPVAAAVLLAVAAAWVARGWMDDPSVPVRASPAQIAANALLVQDVLGYEALSAGLWYVAIDFQLFVALLALLALGRQRPFAVVALLAIASLFVFNRRPEWDAWAPYFFASYALGAFAWWLARRACPSVWGAVLVAAAVGALALDFRIRIAVALGTALTLFAVTRSGVSWRWAETRAMAFLARISYSVFLVHFPVCLLVNAFWTRYLPADPWTSLAGLAFAWGASIAVGALAYRLVESRVDAVIGRLAVAFASFRRARPAAE